MSMPQTEAGKALMRGVVFDGGTVYGGTESSWQAAIVAIEAEARVGYVPASLSPEWHAELALVEAESRNATLDEVVRAVEGLAGSGARGVGTGGNADVIVQTAGDFIWRAAILDAVKGLRS